MAQDIIPMDAWNTECPCCGCKLAVEWQLATYADGGDSPQFVGLKRAYDIPLSKIREVVKKAPPKRITAKSLRAKTYHPQKHNIVQVLNPRTHRYVKIDKTDAKIISHKKTPNPYKGIPIVAKSKEEEGG